MGWAVPRPATLRRGSRQTQSSSSSSAPVRRSRSIPDESLTNAVCGANGAVLAEAKAHPETRGMGTTCTAAIVLPDRLFIAQIGDSRAYLLHDGRLQLLTRDQTMADELVEAGALRPEDVATYPYRHILLQAVGTRSTIEPVTSEVRVDRGNRILLCSDGLHGPVPGQEIARILDASADINRVARELIQAGPGCGRAGQRDRRRGGLRIRAASCRRLASPRLQRRRVLRLVDAQFFPAAGQRQPRDRSPSAARRWASTPPSSPSSRR